MQFTVTNHTLYNFIVYRKQLWVFFKYLFNSVIFIYREGLAMKTIGMGIITYPAFNGPEPWDMCCGNKI